MKLKLVGLLSAAAAVAAAFAAQAATATRVNLSEMTRGYTYYNRPGADMAAHDKDLSECAIEGAKTRSVDDQINNGAYNGLLGMAIGQMISDAANRATFYSGVENCMVVRGWRVVLLPDDEGKAILATGNYGVRETITPWVGAAEPHGQIVRTWNNDAANNTIKRYETRPGRTVDGSLSLVAIYETLTTRPPTADIFDGPPARVQIDKKWPTKPLKPEQVAGLPPFAALVVVNVKGSVWNNGGALTFVRMGPDALTTAASVDNAPDLFQAVPRMGKSEGFIYAIPVPPGRWRIAAMGIMPAINFCLGSPAFEVKAGEVVFAGTFDLSSPTLGPDMSLAPAQAWFAGKPGVEKLRPAEYVNGYTAMCGDNAIYALEIPGAPYREGYAWGGAFRPAAAAPAVTSTAAPAN